VRTPPSLLYWRGIDNNSALIIIRFIHFTDGGVDFFVRNVGKRTSQEKEIQIAGERADQKARFLADSRKAVGARSDVGTVPAVRDRQ
jgi:hypothetical protein